MALREVEDAVVFARNRNERTSTSIPKLGEEGEISIPGRESVRWIGGEFGRIGMVVEGNGGGIGVDGNLGGGHCRESEERSGR